MIDWDAGPIGQRSPGSWERGKEWLVSRRAGAGCAKALANGGRLSGNRALGDAKLVAMPGGVLDRVEDDFSFLLPMPATVVLSNNRSSSSTSNEIVLLLRQLSTPPSSLALSPSLCSPPSLPSSGGCTVATRNAQISLQRAVLLAAASPPPAATSSNILEELRSSAASSN